MQNYKMLVAYDGRKYNGYKRGKKNPEKNIQTKFEQILKKLYGKDVEVINAVNTEPGVHATGQVINFIAPDDKLNKQELFEYCEEYLTDDIVCISIEEVDDRFHSRYLIKSVTYQYRIWKADAKVRPLFERHIVNVMDKPLNVELMNKGREKLLGEHDFAGFTNNTKAKSTVKTIEDLTIVENENEIIISITADGFLVNMARFMVGTLIQLGLKERMLLVLDYAFESGDNKDVGHKAMAPALVLKEVKY